MPATNQIALITKYSTDAWDKIYKLESRSALLDGKTGVNVQWAGTKTVKIAKFNAGGLKNYYRNNSGDSRLASAPNGTGYGYQKSTVGLTWEEFTIKMDRAAYYPIEQFDNEETDGLVLGATVSEVSRLIIIPEVDAYCFSTLAGYCNTTLGNLVTYTGSSGEFKAIDKTNALEAINRAFLYMDEHEIPAEDQILFVSPKFFNYLRNDTTELARYLMQSDYDKNVNFKLTEYEGRKIVSVPPQRFRTAFTTVTDSEDGYAWGYFDETTGQAVESKEIHFILCAKSAVMHVVKYNKVKVLEGDLALAATGQDGYAVYARIYHDLFVMDNKRYAIYTAINGASDAKTVTAATSTTAAKKVKTAENADVD